MTGSGAAAVITVLIYGKTLPLRAQDDLELVAPEDTADPSITIERQKGMEAHRGHHNDIENDIYV